VEFAPQHAVPVFALPELVLFPRTVVPLHVFELRYRAMIRDALEAERMLAMALLKPGWERDYRGSPEFFPVGCLARVQAVEWLPNDCYDLKLAGVSRIQLERVVKEFPYRSARVRLLPQEPFTEDDPLVELERHALAETFLRFARELGSPATLRNDTPIEPLVNHVCMSLALEPADKLALLELDSVIERSRRVREWMDRSAGHSAPPAQGGERN
jgi:Lon protease-like protein